MKVQELRQLLNQELRFPFATMTFTAAIHATVLVFVEALGMNESWSSEDLPGVLFVMLLAALFVVPGAVAAWYARGSIIQLKEWLLLSGYELGCTAILCGLAALGDFPQLIRNFRQTHIESAFLFFVIAFSAIILVMLFLTEERSRSLNYYKRAGRGGRIRVGTPAQVPIGDGGFKVPGTGQAKHFDRRES